MGIPSAPARQRVVTQQQYDKALADFDASGDSVVGGDRADKRQALIDSLIVPPPSAPDLSDQLVQQRATAARRRLLMGGLTGPLNLTPGAVMAPKLGGY